MTSKLEIVKIQISRIEKEIRDTPYHKATEHHHGILKAKLAKLQEQLDGGDKNSSGGGGGGVGYAIKHSGDASVVLLGFPSVGKSTLLNALTNAESKVGNYDFTTLGVVPGMLNYKGVKIQILDLPGIIEGAASNKGFGKKVLSVVRASDLIVLMADVPRVYFFDKIEAELYKNGIRTNQLPPKIAIHKTQQGSIQVVNPFGGLSSQTVVAVAKEMGYGNARINFGQKVESIDQLVDVFMAKNRRYLPLIKVVSKLDLATSAQLQKIPQNTIPLSVQTQTGVEDFKEKLWQGLGLLRVYLKRERNGLPDYQEPLIMHRGQTLDHVLKNISQEMREDVNKAYIWGKKSKFPGQEVSLNYPLFDEIEVWFGR